MLISGTHACRDKQPHNRCSDSTWRRMHIIGARSKLSTKSLSPQPPRATRVTFSFGASFFFRVRQQINKNMQLCELKKTKNVGALEKKLKLSAHSKSGKNLFGALQKRGKT